MGLRRIVGWKNQNFWLEELLTERFERILAETEKQAWSRQKYFKLQKPIPRAYFANADDLVSESQMELMLQYFWGLQHIQCPVVPKKLWHRIVSRQIPIQSGLTEIARADLLGCDEVGNPVILELKSRWGVMIPLELLLQAAEYAVRLKACWSFLRAEWEPYLGGFGYTVPLVIPKTFPVVIVAPPEFWSCLFAERKRFDVRLFVSVAEKFGHAMLPIHFMEIRPDETNQSLEFRPRLRLLELQALCRGATS